MNEIQFNELTKRYLDCPYFLGDTVQGFDCITLIFDFYGALGVKLPEEFNGWTLGNYAERWSRGEGRDELLDFLTSLGTSVEKNYMRRGDLVIFKADILGAGIYLGNGSVLGITTDGGKVFSIRTLDKFIHDIRRLT